MRLLNIFDTRSQLFSLLWQEDILNELTVFEPFFELRFSLKIF